MKYVAVLSAPPPGLADFTEHNPQTIDWSVFRNNEAAAYRELRNRLRRVQRGLCAFCEIKLHDHDEQIEHWVPKSTSTPQSNWTFDVGNLHASCENVSKKHWFSDDPARAADPQPGPNSSCGQAKGNTSPSIPFAGAVPYRPTDLPIDRQIFRVVSDGSISAIPQACHDAGLDDQRAQSTLALLKLDCTRLRHMRRAVIEYLDRELDLAFSRHEDPVQALRETCGNFLFIDKDGSLPNFLSTIRSFFGAVAEEKLREMPGWEANNDPPPREAGADGGMAPTRE